MRADLRPVGRLFAYGALIAVGLGLAAAAAGCAATVEVTNQPVRPGAMWCFAATVKGGRHAVGCFDSQRFCKASLSYAHQWSSMADAYNLTNCQLMEVR